MNRREFIAQTLVAAAPVAAAVAQPGGSAVAVRVLKSAETNYGGGHYTPNRAPLTPGAFQRLSPGSIKPGGWLRHQLQLQADGLNGRMPEISDYLRYDNCGWVDPTKNAWEEMPYWLRGFGDLGYVTGDGRVLAESRRWIEGILKTQASDGWFGPAKLRTSLEGGPDFWPGMPLLDALRTWQEYSGDSRVVPFLLRYFQFQNAQPAAVYKRGWGKWRWGDNIDTVYWTYNRTGEPWLLDLVRKMHENSADYVSDIPTWHNVNLAQGFREPAQYSMLSKDAAHLSATYRNYETVMSRFGQFPGGGFAGDENCRPGYADPRQGFETCGIVEFMHSFEMLTRLTGDPVWADRCEELAFNLLPAAFDPQGKGTHYVTCANSIQLDNAAKTHGQFDNKFAMSAYMPGIHNYRCCPHNYGMGWPYYAEELWLATPDGGLCASLYAASEVNARVGDGTAVRLVTETDYPFGDTVRIEIQSPKEIGFPLYLRIPRWCERPHLEVNGVQHSIEARGPAYMVLNRLWRSQDTVLLQLPMQIAVRAWQANHNAISVDRGPLTFSLAVEERWKQSGGDDRWPEYEVFANSPWNYGLIVNDQHPERSFEVHEKSEPVPPNPFVPANVPLVLSGKARRIPEWTADDEHVINPLQQSPAKTEEPVETVSLIPMGAARLRITSFPAASTGPDAHQWVAAPASQRRS